MSRKKTYVTDYDKLQHLIQIGDSTNLLPLTV